MARWPVDPEWVDPDDGINQGNQYTSSDGVTVSDFNTLIKDLIYLRNIEAPVIQATKTVDINNNGTFEITPSTGYDALSKVIAIVNITTTSPTLYAPTISLSGDTLTITPNASNGAFNDAVTYVLYDLTDEETYELDSLQIDLSEIITTVGDHLLKVRANRANFISADSNQVTYTVSQEQWDTPTIQLNNSVVSTPIVSGVTKYKVYVDSVYVGYVDANGTYHDVSSGHSVGTN